MKLRWDPFRRDVMVSFEYLAAYISTIDKQLEQAKNVSHFSLVSKHEPIIAQTEDEALEQFAEYDLEQDVHKTLHENLYPKILSYSAVIMLFMLVETQLSRVCGEIEKNANRPASYANEKPFKRAKRVLATFKITEIPHWQQICDLQKIRHCVVHCAGDIKKSHDAEYITKLIAKDVGVKGPDSQGQIIIDMNYTRLLLGAVDKFFQEIFQRWLGPEDSILKL